MKLIRPALLFAIGVNGITAASPQYSFKCARDMFMCGGITQSQVCNNPGTVQYIPANDAQCAGMIAATTRPGTFEFKCPNNRAISHWVVYDPCNSRTGMKTEPGRTVSCPCPSGQCGSTSICTQPQPLTPPPVAEPAPVALPQPLTPPPVSEPAPISLPKPVAPPSNKPPTSGGGGGGGGTVGGDPHFRTHDGTMYSFHGECDLVMATSKSFGNGLGLDVHTRTQIVAGWSLVSNAAVRIGSDVLEISNDGHCYYNGTVDVQFPITMSDKYKVTTSKEIVKQTNQGELIRNFWNIDIENGEFIRIIKFKDMLSVNVKAALPDTHGMLGSSTKPGMVGRNGHTIVSNPDAFGMEWQVKDTEIMLFHVSRAPQYPQQCILPKVSSRRLRHSESAQRRAQEACLDVTDPTLRAFCMEDVLLTGDVSSASTYGIVF